MSAGVAAHAVAIELLIKFAFADILIDDFAQGGHDNSATDSVNPAES
jgi:hypothetical protein